MSTLKTAYGTSGQTITCTLASLASLSARESATIDNTTDLFIDVLVMLQLKTQAGTPGSDQLAYCYVWGTVDNGTSHPDTVTGADAAITLESPTQLRVLGTMFVGTASHTFTGGPWSVSQMFGGTMPQKWGIVVLNRSGMTLDATEANHKKIYQGIYATVA